MTRSEMKMSCLFMASLLIGCGNSAVDDPIEVGATMPSTGTLEDTDILLAKGPIPQDPLSRPGKEYVPQLGVYLPVVADCRKEVEGGGAIALVRSDGTMTFRFGWEKDPATTWKELSKGIWHGNKVVITNGEQEDWGNNRTAFGTVFGDPATGVTDQYRINVWETGHAKGTFYAGAYFTANDEATYALAKQRLLELLDGIVHVTAQEEEALAAKAEADLEKQRTQRLKSLNEGEKQMMKALGDKAYVKSTYERYPSSLGSATYEAYTRYQFCGSGRMTYFHRSNSNVTSTTNEYQGNGISQNVETANLRSHDKDNYSGSWYVEIRNGSRVMVIDPDAGPEQRYNFELLQDQLVLDGLKLWIRRPGQEEGPQCN